MRVEWACAPATITTGPHLLTFNDVLNHPAFVVDVALVQPPGRCIEFLEREAFQCLLWRAGGRWQQERLHGNRRENERFSRCSRPGTTTAQPAGDFSAYPAVVSNSSVRSEHPEHSVRLPSGAIHAIERGEAVQSATMGTICLGPRECRTLYTWLR
jgi:hypothetical protein